MKFGASTWLWTSPFDGRDVSLLRKIADLGFSFVEIPVENPTTVDAPAIRRALDATGLQVVVCAVMAGERDPSSVDPARVEAAATYLRQCVALACEWGSPLVVGPLYAPVGKKRLPTVEARAAEWSRSVAQVRRMAEEAAAAGVKLGLEPLNRFESDLINTAADAVRMAEEVGGDLVGVSLDSFHMNIEEVDFRQAIETAGARLVHLQVSDSHRGVPGEGNSDWPGLRTGLRNIGYAGRVAIESFSPDTSSLAEAVCIWRRFAETQDVFAARGLRFLQHWQAGGDARPATESKL